MDKTLLYTRQEAADKLRISVSQLDNLARQRKIRRVKFGESGRSRVMYRPEDIKNYVDMHLAAIVSDL